jgi:uncharacterized protein YjaG (DUF416 family)
MTVYPEYDKTILAWSSTLSPWHGLIYCLTVCKRSAPFYFEFVEREGWGDIEAIKLSHQLLRLAIEQTLISTGLLTDCLQRLNDHIPDTDDFEDCTFAQDATAIHIYSTELLKAWNPSHVYYVARYCYEIADVEAFDEILPNGGIVTPEIEQQAEQHEFITEELQWQQRIRKELEKLEQGNVQAAMDAIEEWARTPLSRKKV